MVSRDAVGLFIQLYYHSSVLAVNGLHHIHFPF